MASFERSVRSFVALIMPVFDFIFDALPLCTLC